MDNLYRASEIITQIERIHARQRELDDMTQNKDVKAEARNLNSRYCQLMQEYRTLPNCGNW